MDTDGRKRTQSLSRGEVDAKRVHLLIGSVSCEAVLLEAAAPRTTAALWGRLPIVDRTIQARWSGDAWRTEGNYELLTPGDPVENRADRLSAGDIIYYPGYASKLLKIAVAYGPSQWLAPFMSPLPVSLIGRIDVNLEAFVERCQRIIFEGPLDVKIARA